jgi:hypothetical protein
MLMYIPSWLYNIHILPSLLLQLQDTRNGGLEACLEPGPPALAAQPLALETLTLVELLGVPLVADLFVELPDMRGLMKTVRPTTGAARMVCWVVGSMDLTELVYLLAAVPMMPAMSTGL